MSTPPNLELFNETVGKTFAFLYENFPVERSISLEKLLELKCLKIGSADFEEAEKKRDICYYSIKWLIDAGYISAEPRPYSGFADAVLTVRGVELLKIRPKALSDTFGDSLLKLSKSGIMGGVKNSLSGLTSTMLTAGATISYHMAMVHHS
ncbi:hypothetical protein [Serratia quinivorans]|uniref:hypothetical protein n=1 Tax=Serratia quinivorans TaxID=137545 RepID=UPI0021BD18FA|nr:hypothetical protein [Serratia quinivorans]